MPEQKASHNPLIILMKMRSVWCLLNLGKAELRSHWQSDTNGGGHRSHSASKPISVYEQQLSHVQLHASTATLKTYNGGSLTVKVEATVPVRYGEQHATAKIIAVDVRDNQPFLGGTG